ncbi:PAS-domain containing protein [Simiduia curdlanivorans]|uniref:histidine kinase n=1 Tax=Simiduia curdlanivorans TaxID=1492769 RepID=A0ABV8V249_9GAMM|nr:PAS-domain containing protein [Simiduia curdlanivorans]MDN3640044.1 PAS-domain containing protein [Simiduia curdlanivorans]
MNSQLVLLLAFVYAGLLFLVAWKAERLTQISPKIKALMYALSLAVYCSSWTFFAAVGLAAESGWDFLPIYLGPVLLFGLGWPFLRKLSVISQRNRVTSIADFIGSRYGKHQLLASVVTLLAVIGTLPYIALQLKAVSLAWQTVDAQWPSVSTNLQASNSLIAAIIMVWFAILFGTRTLDGPHRHQGLISAIGVESLVKLLSFILVAWLAFKVLSNANSTPHELAALPSALKQLPVIDANFLTQTLLALAAIICLPRQFHLTFVEHHSSQGLRTARWLLPLYLIIFSVLVVPIALAGQSLFDLQSVAGDTIVLRLPLAENSPTITAMAFLGGISAATGMVVVAAITLSIMISNELVVPLWLRFGSNRQFRAEQLGQNLRNVRRLAIAIVLMLGWLLEQHLSADNSLPSIGLIAFASAAQLLPSLVAALYWQRGHRNGVLAGLLGGAGIWFYCLLIPALLGADHPLVTDGPGQIHWLIPTNLFGVDSVDPLTQGVFWSLLINCLLFYLVSSFSRFNALDIRQANAFTQLHRRFHYAQQDFDLSGIEIRQLQRVITPLMGEQRSLALWREFEQKLSHRLLPHDKAPRFVLAKVESALAAIIGAVSAHRTMELLRKQQPLMLEDLVNLVGGTSKQVQFSQELLQTTLETIPQGVSVVGAQLQLVAWNKRYEEMFNYPPRLLYVGCPISRIYEFNAARGIFAQDDKDLDAAIQRRLNWLKDGKSYRLERRLPNHTVIEIRGIPLANGGYVTTYTDISEYRRVQEELEQSKDQLESRVAERTTELIESNQSLQRENQLRAKLEKELSAVHASKTRFLAAASHDMAQPINAARLFVAALAQKAEKRGDDELLNDTRHIGDALASTETLIESLREISRLDGGKLSPKREHFSASSLLEPLAREFSAIAREKGLIFHWQNSRCWLYSDPQLLRRIVQNFLSNAINHTRAKNSEGKRNKILFGCRRQNGHLWLEVWDTGPGIALEDQQRIFNEFERVQCPSGEVGNGLGLGLSIAQRMAHQLGHSLELRSTLAQGSMFRIAVPRGNKTLQNIKPANQVTELTGLKVLCIDNEPQIRSGLLALLTQWDCQVITAADLGTSLTQWRFLQAPDVVLADFHLDNQENGLDLLQALCLHWHTDLAGLIISADNSDDIRAKVNEAGFSLLTKPVQPAALRAAMRNLMKKN